MLLALGYAALGTGFLFLMTTSGAATVFCLRGDTRPRFQMATLGFAAGVMTAASVWSLLIPALQQAESDFAFPAWIPAAVGTLSGAAFLIALDDLIPRLRRIPETAERRRTILLVSAITLHNIPEGMAVGLSCAMASRTGAAAGAIALALGVGVQNFPEGAAVSLPIRQEGGSSARAFLYGTLSGAVEPVFGSLTVLIASLVVPAMP